MLAGIAFFALLYGALNLFVPDLFNGSIGLQAQGEQLSQTQGYVQLAWIYLPFIALVVLSIGLLSRAAFESRGGV
jgi:branched-subunit amino acid permease